jgi:chemotaxis-related protein WspB
MGRVFEARQNFAKHWWASKTRLTLRDWLAGRASDGHRQILRLRVRLTDERFSAVAMLVLKFQVGRDSFAVDSGRIVAVTPLAKLRPLPHAPAYLAGLLQYRGRAVPVVDLNRLLGAGPSAARLSTRIILVEPAPNGPLLGLQAERVSDLKATAEDLARPALSVPDAPYLGPVVEMDGEMVQILAVENLLPPALYSSVGEPS